MLLRQYCQNRRPVFRVSIDEHVACIGTELLGALGVNASRKVHLVYMYIIQKNLDLSLVSKVK